MLPVHRLTTLLDLWVDEHAGELPDELVFDGPRDALNPGMKLLVLRGAEVLRERKHVRPAKIIRPDREGDEGGVRRQAAEDLGYLPVERPRRGARARQKIELWKGNGLLQLWVERPGICEHGLVTGGLIVGEPIARGHRISQGKVVDRER